MGIPVQPNKAIVGQNAFSHESGIHVHGMLGQAQTYEAITPELVGCKRSIVLGKHTGVHAIKAKLEEMNIETSDDQMIEVTSRIKELGDWGKSVTNDDLRAIAEEVLGRVSKDERSVEPLIDALGSEITAIRSNAVVALGPLMDKRATMPLIQILEDETEDDAIRGNAITSLGAIADSRAVDALMVALNSDSITIKQKAALALGDLAADVAVGPLMNIVSDANQPTTLRANAATASLRI